jgi:hypothetical protein
VAVLQSDSGRDTSGSPMTVMDEMAAKLTMRCKQVNDSSLVIWCYSLSLGEQETEMLVHLRMYVMHSPLVLPKCI